MEKLNQILKAHVADGQDTKDKLLGASFIVVKADGPLYEGAAGRIGLADDSKPWSVDTLTMMASLTKLPAAIAILQVVERGLLTLDEDLRPRLKALAETQILRGFDETTGQPIYEPNPAPVTLRILLTHRGGFVYDLPDPAIMRWRTVTGNTKIHNSWTKEALYTPMLFEPGTAWNYGTNIEWAALALEQATGQGLHAYMAENIFKPLGMENSSIGPGPAAKSTEELLARLATCPSRAADGTLEAVELPHPMKAEEYDLESGGAGLFSTAKDYSKLLQAVLRGDLLQPETMELLFKPQLEGEVLADLRAKLAPVRPLLAPEYTDDTPTNFAFGGMLNLKDIPGKRAKDSLMWSGWMNCHWWIDPKNKIAAVYQVCLLPFADTTAIKLYDELERAVYGELLVGSEK